MSETHDDRDRLRHLYLAALLHWPTDQLTPRWSAWEQHVWNSLAAFNETVRLITETRQKEYAQLIRLLRERDLLTDDELPGLSTTLLLAFQDNRAVQVPPLPPPTNPTLLADWR